MGLPKTTDGCDPGTKRCSTCKVAKDFSMFCRCATNRDGYQFSCKACKNQFASKWTRANPDKMRGYRATTRTKTSYQEHRRQYNRDYERNKKATDAVYRLKCNLRTRFIQAVKNGSKGGSAVSALGCSVVEFKAKMEALFQPGMTWENWGKVGWHLDHVIPLSAFDLTDPSQVAKACHYSNLRPLWAIENLRKGATHGVPTSAND